MSSSLFDLSGPTALSVPAIDPDRLAELRGRAASRLTGAATTKGSPAHAADALAVLFALASSPRTASDALTLLHELQVHQVELDLQAQELQESRAELESTLRRQIELHDAQPAGCFAIDGQRVLRELNQTGADMLGIRRDAAEGLGLDTFLCQNSVRRLRSAMVDVDAGELRSSCSLKLCPRDGAERPALASIARDPAGSGFLVSLMDAGGEQVHERKAS